jgi:hypothetical protein
VIAVRESFSLFRRAILALCVALAPYAAASAAPAKDDMAIAQSLAEMLRDARTVISDQQNLINNPQLGDKHLTGEVVLEQGVAKYSTDTGIDPRKLDPASRQGRLLRAMMAAIVEVVDDNQATINEKGTGFKGFIPAVFARLVAESFDHLAKGEAEVKVTAPLELVRNRKARPTRGRPRSSRSGCSIRLGLPANRFRLRSKPKGGRHSGSWYQSITWNPASPVMVRQRARWTSPAIQRRAGS